MRIGELSTRTAVSRDTIRLYERMGLLAQVARPHPMNNYKEYAANNVKRIGLIKNLKSFGFTLKECHEVISLMEGDRIDEDNRRELITRKLIEIENKIQELSRNKGLLEDILLTKDCTRACE